MHMILRTSNVEHVNAITQYLNNNKHDQHFTITDSYSKQHDLNTTNLYRSHAVNQNVFNF